MQPIGKSWWCVLGGWEAHKEMIVFYKFDNIEANTIVSAIKDVLQRLTLPISKCRSQCYDDARPKEWCC